MLFSEAIEIMRKGGRVRRAIWQVKESNIAWEPSNIPYGFKQYHGDKGYGTCPTLTGSAIMADDWELYKNP